MCLHGLYGDQVPTNLRRGRAGRKHETGKTTTLDDIAKARLDDRRPGARLLMGGHMGHANPALGFFRDRVDTNAPGFDTGEAVSRRGGFVQSRSWNESARHLGEDLVQRN